MAAYSVAHRRLEQLGLFVVVALLAKVLRRWRRRRTEGTCVAIVIIVVIVVVVVVLIALARLDVLHVHKNGGRRLGMKRLLLLK